MSWRQVQWIVMCLTLIGAPNVRSENTRRLSLKEAEELAIRSHPGVNAADLMAAAAKEVTMETRSAFFPNLYASVTGAGAPENSRIAAGALNNPIIYSRLATGVSISQLITDLGRTAHLTDSARLKANARSHAAQATRDEVLLAVDRAYFETLRAGAVLKVAEQTVAARQLIADQVSELAKSNLRSGLDVSFAKVSLSEAKLLLVAAQNDIKAKQADLSVALGYQDLQVFELVDLPLPPLALPDLTQLLNEAIQNRPDLADLRYEHQSALKFAQAERALTYPTISLFGTVGGTPIRVEQLEDHYSAVGINVNIPVFNGHLFSARRRESEFEARAKLENLRELENRVTHEVRIAWLDANTASQRIGLTVELLNQASQALDLAQARYDLGLNSIVDLSQAQLNKTAAEISSASAKYDFLARLAMLDFMVGKNH